MLYTKGVDQIIIKIKGDVYTWYKRSLNLLSLPGFILDIWMKILPWRFTFKSIVFKLKITKYSVFLRDRIKMMIFRMEPNGPCGNAPRFFSVFVVFVLQNFFFFRMYENFIKSSNCEFLKVVIFLFGQGFSQRFTTPCLF